MSPAPEPRVAIIGTGYGGLTTGAALASLGYSVVCAEIDAERIALLRQGHIPIVEEGIEALVQRESGAGRPLTFDTDSAGAVAGADLVFLCVPTPSRADGRSDVNYIKAASAELREALGHGAVVINKSTVPVGSTKVVKDVL